MSESSVIICSYPIGKSISGENWPGSPVCVMLISGVHMLSEAIYIMRWKFSRQLYVLVCKNQRSHVGVKPECVQGKKRMDRHYEVSATKGSERWYWKMTRRGETKCKGVEARK